MIDDIVITCTGKNRVTVILDIEGYIKETERQLHDAKNHWQLNCDPTAINNETGKNAIRRFHKE